MATCDVFVAAEHRGNGVGSFLVVTATSHPLVREVHQFLATTPGRTLYARQGFEPLSAPDRWMERRGSVS
jgi:GNAT superfamily N-acetyltransferase